MVGNKHVGGGRGKADGVNKGPDSLSGRSDPADPDTGQSQQDSGHYTGGSGAGRDGGIVSAAPESNVGPPGAAQSSRGSASAPAQGGTAGATSGERGGKSVGAAAGGAPGSSEETPGPDSKGGAVEDPARESPNKPGAADTR